jgi:hypothetical protein
VAAVDADAATGEGFSRSCYWASSSSPYSTATTGEMALVPATTTLPPSPPLLPTPQKPASKGSGVENCQQAEVVSASAFGFRTRTATLCRTRGQTPGKPYADWIIATIDRRTEIQPLFFLIMLSKHGKAKSARLI